MRITTRTSGDCTILELEGRLIYGPDARELGTTVREVTRNSPRKVILNLRKVTYADSCGIGELVSVYIHVKNLGSKLALTDLPDRVNKLLFIAKLRPLFEIFDNEEAAIAGSQESILLRRMCG